MSDFSFSVRCPFCGGRYAPDDGSCCEPPDEEEGEDEGGVGMGDGAPRNVPLRRSARPMPSDVR